MSVKSFLTIAAPRRLNDKSGQQGYVLATLISFMAIIAILGAVVLQLSVQSQKINVRQQFIQQAQLAAAAAMDYAKEQYELDITYMGTAETDFTITNRYRTTFQVEHIEFTNGLNTQQKVRAIGRVYEGDAIVAISEREILGNLTRIAGSDASTRFIFIVDNSGSMSVSEWNDSKTTVDIAINYVLANVPSSEVAVLQYGTNQYSYEHKYDVTVPFTSDATTATGFDRRYGHGTTATDDKQDYLPGSLARMRDENVYGSGGELDLSGATNIQYVLFTDAYGGRPGTGSWPCCSSLKKVSGEIFDSDNGGDFTTEDQHGEINALKDGTVYDEHGYSGLSSQFTVLNINVTTSYETIDTSAAIASPGGSYSGSVDANSGDPEGEGIIPRRYIDDSLEQTDPTKILEIIDEIIEAELNF